MNTNLRKITEICNTSADFRGKIIYGESLADHTTFKVGGDARVFVQPDNEKSCMFLLSLLRENRIPFFILGGGSNVVVADEGLEGCILCTKTLNDLRLQDDVLYCGAGTSFDAVTDFCIAHGLSGLENFAGLPGTVGGAVYMNARCYEKSISDVLLFADYAVPEDDEAWRYTMNETDWDYKKSPFMARCAKQKPCLILSAAFKVEKGEASLIEQRCRGFIKDREEKGHFRYPCAGSVFKNNRAFGKPSGKIIDEALLRGVYRGGAQVAPWHGNFIVNTGGASADSIKELVQYVQSEVKRRTGFSLECEIIFIDNSLLGFYTIP